MCSEGSYESLAAEYYDDHHVTSRNFDAATVAALESIDIGPPRGHLLEVGCGRGRAREFLGVSSDRVVQLDNSPAMLALRPREGCMLRVLHRADQLPFPDGEFAVVAAFLCDAYLGLTFLSEARRVLRPGGLFIATTPAHEWGSALRRTLGLDVMVTRFILSTGEKLEIPSALYPRSQLEAMLARSGFRPNSVSVRTHGLPLDTEPISQDILEAARALAVDPFKLPILYSLVAEA